MTESVPRPVLVARTPEDVLATVPVVLGFHPEESMVMLTMSRRATFHARVDLPPRARDLPTMAQLLLVPVLRHEVDAVVLVAYSARREFAHRAVRATVRIMEQAGVAVRVALTVSRGRWFQALPGLPAGPGVPFDISAHPHLLEAVLRGEVVHADRDQLRSTVQADPDRVSAVAECLARRGLPAHPRRQGRLGLTRESDSPQQAAESAWLRGVFAIDPGSLETAGLSPDQIARVLAGLRTAELVDEVLAHLRRDSAKGQVAVLTWVVQAAPPGWVAEAAALLACAAWVSGDGALAWCAVDRCLAEQPDHDLGQAIGRALELAVPPSRWEELASARAGNARV